jgi:tetratricopeptide (TPR) repeat protein
MAGLKTRQFKYAEAMANATRALSINTYDPAANYYYALANLKLGNSTNAKDGFDIAASSVEYRSAAYMELAKMYFIDKDLPKAIEYAKKSLLNNQYNIEGLQLLAVIYRQQKDETKAKAILNTINTIDPLNHFVRFEKYCWDNSLQSKTLFTSKMLSELPQQNFWNWVFGITS